MYQETNCVILILIIIVFTINRYIAFTKVNYMIIFHIHVYQKQICYSVFYKTLQMFTLDTSILLEYSKFPILSNRIF